MAEVCSCDTETANIHHHHHKHHQELIRSKLNRTLTQQAAVVLPEHSHHMKQQRGAVPASQASSLHQLSLYLIHFLYDL
ncbi:hypothetical protein E2C01_045646 [Portunus trituberculatus]|uniref:Uncharacterized protein n=1 Tax=Portunus trituberculatus TaxID=210409 RepID=A0A5B7G3J7_PORTR|nr:hypothetical protein [Portunus trituberculatus]